MRSLKKDKHRLPSVEILGSKKKETSYYEQEKNVDLDWCGSINIFRDPY